MVSLVEKGDDDVEMGSLPQSRLLTEKVPLLWDSRFKVEAGISDYVDEHGEETPWIELRTELRRRYEQERGPELDEENGVILDFLQGTDEVDICMPKANEILDFCHGASMAVLREEKWPSQHKLPANAWVDERSFRSGVQSARPNTGPLTAHGLYKRLRKPRFRAGGAGHGSGSTNPEHHPDRVSFGDGGRAAAVSAEEAVAREALKFSAASADLSLRSCLRFESLNDPELESDMLQEVGDGEGEGEGEGEDEPDADRQLIYVQGLDSWTAYALIGTVSPPLAPALRDALYSHLASETFVGVTLPGQGPWVFRLEMHLPFPVWRQSLIPREDLRRGRDGEPLRHYTDVTFLNWGDAPTQEYIYEGHVSCVVVGSNEQIWSAYCFEDKYFESPDYKHNVQDYYEDSLAQEGTRLDPLSNGELEADCPRKNAREYFLALLQARTEQLKCHWLLVAVKQSRSIRTYKRTYRSALYHAGARHYTREASNYDRTLQRSFDWVRKIRDLSMNHSDEIAKTVGAYKIFLSRHAGIFHDLDESARGAEMLCDIDKLVGELELLRRDFKSMARCCESFAKDLDTYLGLESIEASIRQRRLAQDNNGLAEVMMKYVTPIGLTAAIFSMDQKVLPPFMPQSWLSFICLLAVFFGLGYSIIHCQMDKLAATVGRAARQLKEAALDALLVWRNNHTNQEPIEVGEPV